MGWKFGGPRVDVWDEEAGEWRTIQGGEAERVAKALREEAQLVPPSLYLPFGGMAFVSAWLLLLMLLD